MSLRSLAEAIDRLPEMLPTLDDLSDLLDIVSAEPGTLMEALDDRNIAGPVADALRHLHQLIDADPTTFVDALADEDRDLDELIETISSSWLGSADDDADLWHAAVELLAIASAANREPLRFHLARLTSSDPRERIWGARTVRLVAPERADALLQALRDDPYRDEDGRALVCEAAGFAETARAA